MKMNARAKVTSKGQITLPKEVRARLKINEGDEIEFIEHDGKMWIWPRNVDIMDLAGMLHRPGMAALTAEEMEQSIMDAVVEDDGRIKREWRKDAE